MLQIGFEQTEEFFVEWNRACFDFRPGSCGTGGGDGVVDVAEGDVVGFFVVEDGLEGGDDLRVFLVFRFLFFARGKKEGCQKQGIEQEIEVGREGVK